MPGPSGSERWTVAFDPTARKTLNPHRHRKGTISCPILSSSSAIHYAARIGFVRNRLIIDGLAEPTAQSLAVLSISSLQGALIQSRVERSARPLETAADERVHRLDPAFRQNAWYERVAARPAVQKGVTVPEPLIDFTPLKR